METQVMTTVKELFDATIQITPRILEDETALLYADSEAKRTATYCAEMKGKVTSITPIKHRLPVGKNRIGATCLQDGYGENTSALYYLFEFEIEVS